MVINNGYRNNHNRFIYLFLSWGRKLLCWRLEQEEFVYVRLWESAGYETRGLHKKLMIEKARSHEC